MRDISEQLFQLFSQTIFHMLLQDTASFLRYLLFFIFAVNLTFGLHLTLEFQKRIQNPSERSKMELFVKAVNGFRR